MLNSPALSTSVDFNFVIIFGARVRRVMEAMQNLSFRRSSSARKWTHPSLLFALDTKVWLLLLGRLRFRLIPSPKHNICRESFNFTLLRFLGSSASFCNPVWPCTAIAKFETWPRDTEDELPPLRPTSCGFHRSKHSHQLGYGILQTVKDFVKT